MYVCADVVLLVRCSFDRAVLFLDLFTRIVRYVIGGGMLGLTTVTSMRVYLSCSIPQPYPVVQTRASWS